jgi:hypothetical protein
MAAVWHSVPDHSRGGSMAEAAADYLVLHEFIKRAKQNLDRNAWDYLIGGA